jgi:hypothetical protein
MPPSSAWSSKMVAPWPKAAQLVGRRQAGGAAADDGDLLAGFTGRLLEADVVVQGPVAKEVLDGVDADVFFHHVAVAAGLAGSRADTAHDGREGVGGGETTEGVFLPALAAGGLFDAAHDVQVAADILAGGAGALAGRGGKHILRALVRPAGLENLFLGTAIVFLGLAVLVTAPGQTFGFLYILGCDSHLRSPIVKFVRREHQTTLLLGLARNPVPPMLPQIRYC